MYMDVNVLKINLYLSQLKFLKKYEKKKKKKKKKKKIESKLK